MTEVSQQFHTIPHICPPRHHEDRREGSVEVLGLV